MLPDGQLATIVIDHGSETWKVGWAGEDSPRILLPPVVGVPKNSHLMIGLSSKERYIGDEAVSKRGVLRLSYPFKRGIINDWDNMEKLWHYTFYNELRVDPSEHRLLITDTICTPKCQREQMCESLIEDHSPLSISIANRQVLACYSQGLTNAVCAMLGHSGTFVAAVSEGIIVNSTASYSELGGESLTLHLRDCLNKQGYELTTSAELMIVGDIKRHCEVALDYNKILRDLREGLVEGKHYEMPDGQLISLDDAVYIGPEVYFQPHLAGIEQPSLPVMIAKTLERCDDTVKATLNNRCIVTGGSALFPGMAARLQSELKCILSAKDALQVKVSPSAKYDSWIGGSILASLQSFANLSLTREEYEEQGAVHLLAKAK